MLNEAERMTDEIANVIQATYGDATQTALDRKAARAILERLIGMGVMPPSVVAAIVADAGGTVTIPDHRRIDPPALEVFWVRDPGAITLRTRPGAQVPA